MGKSGERQADSLDQTIYDQFYNQAAGGGNINYSSLPADRQQAAQLGAQAGASIYQQNSLMEQMASAFAMPEMSSVDTGPSYEEQMAEQARIQGESDRDTLYSSYMDAASSATEYINSVISTERQNAALLGVDYQIDDTMKSQKINDYFATIWGEGDQTQLETLMTEWGNPEGFEGFQVTRGDAGNFAGETATDTVTAKSEGIKPVVPLIDEEDTLGSASVLGE